MTTDSWDAPAPVRARRRRWPWVLLSVVILLGGLLVAADRIIVNVAQTKIADRLEGRTPFVGRPSVSINGFPFLTQAAGGVYDDIEVRGAGQPVGKLGPVQIDAHLHGLHLSLADATRHVDRVPVDRGDITVSVSLAALASASGIPGLSLTQHGDQITARGPVDVAGLGTVTVSATGRLIINSAGDVTADLTSLAGVGVTLPASAEAAARKELGLIVAVDDLPFQAAAVSVRVDAGRVLVTGTARDFVLE